MAGENDRCTKALAMGDAGCRKQPRSFLQTGAHMRCLKPRAALAGAAVQVKSYLAPPCFVAHWVNAHESRDGRHATLAAHTAQLHISYGMLSPGVVVRQCMAAKSPMPWHFICARTIRLARCLQYTEATIVLLYLPPCRYLYLDAAVYEDPSILQASQLELKRYMSGPGGAQ